jgi:hypothetical protein
MIDPKNVRPFMSLSPHEKLGFQELESPRKLRGGSNRSAPSRTQFRLYSLIFQPATDGAENEKSRQKPARFAAALEPVSGPSLRSPMHVRS